MNTDKDRAEFERELDKIWPAVDHSGMATDPTQSTRPLFCGLDMLRLWQAARSRSGAVPAVTDEMVQRFLGWRLPKDFAPDCGVSFTPIDHPLLWPTGTNLLHDGQARAMLEHVLAAPEPPQGDANADLRRLCALSATVVRAAFFAAEDSEDDGSEFIRVDRQSWESLAASLEALDDLPEIADGKLRHGYATLADLIERAIGGRNER